MKGKDIYACNAEASTKFIAKCTSVCTMQLCVLRGKTEIWTNGGNIFFPIKHQMANISGTVSSEISVTTTQVHRGSLEAITEDGPSPFCFHKHMGVKSLRGERYRRERGRAQLLKK